MEHILEVSDLKISFLSSLGKAQAVRGISFYLNKGETLAIIGESGSGKSVTAKSIMGLLDDNALVEGGKILYDGKDLLHIDDDDFHYIRGDKIAYVFQNPLASLNPILKIGRQLTESMILKAKDSQNEARINFDKKLNNLNYYLNIVFPDDYYKNQKECQLLRNFCLEGSKTELPYNRSEEAIHDILNLIEKNKANLSKGVNFDNRKLTKKINILMRKIYHPLGITQCEETRAIQEALKNKNDNSSLLNVLEKLEKYLNAFESREKPDFFAIGYAAYTKKEESAKKDIPDLNKENNEALNNEFLNAFKERINKSYEYQYQECNGKKEALIKQLNTYIEKLSNTEHFDVAEMHEIYHNIHKKVLDCIYCLDIKKNSVEYTFNKAYENACRVLFEGIKNNPKNQKKYEKQQADYDYKTRDGKKLSWVVTPPTLVDLELQQNNIINLLKSLKECYEKQIKEEKNVSEKTASLIEYFKNQSSLMVRYLNNAMAKEKAIKLLEEVGIRDPETRYEQYPFELSGGMRQRVVIAIALSQNPEILICDEPTTALDVTIQAQILDLINKMKKERNLSVIFITHALGVVANIADRVLVMYAGKLVETGTIYDIFCNPKHPYTWALLSSIPDIDSKEKLESIPGTPPNIIYPPEGDAFAERNKYALEIDFLKEPPLFEISKTHYAATWLVHPNAPHIEMPKIVKDRIEKIRKELPAEILESIKDED